MTKKPTRAALSPAELLTLIAERAPSLRAAGVLQVSIDGLGAVLAPDAPMPSSMPAPKPRPSYVDPLEDPDTFPTGRVPGYKREG
jgi:hypothetical protein